MGGVDILDRYKGSVGGHRIARLADGRLVSVLLPEATGHAADLGDWVDRLAGLGHPCVPAVQRVEGGGVAFEHVEGETLAARVLRTGQGLSEPEALSVVLQIAGALRAAHTHGLSHGQVEPRTVVLVERPGTLCRARLEAWRPPPPGEAFEQRVRRDLYGLHAVLYMALTGRRIEDTLPPDARGGEWVRVDLTAGGLGRSALVALAKAAAYDNLDDFVDHLLPWYRDCVGAIEQSLAHTVACTPAPEELEAGRRRLARLEHEAAQVQEWLAWQAGPAWDASVEDLMRRERVLHRHGEELLRLVGWPSGPRGGATPAPVTAATPGEPTPPPGVTAVRRMARAWSPLRAFGGGAAAALCGVGLLWIWQQQAPRPANEPVTPAPAAAAAAQPDAASLTDPAVSADAPDAAALVVEHFDPVDVARAAADAGPPDAAVAEAPPPPPEGMVAVSAGELRLGLDEAQVRQLVALCREQAGSAWWAAERCDAALLEPERDQAARPVAAFYLDRREVSYAEYDACRAARACELPRLRWERPEDPVVGVTRAMAADYCAFRGGRLPTADEWTYAARGGDQRLFPWGDSPPGAGPAARANHGALARSGGRPSDADGFRYVAPVGGLGEAGGSPFGAFELAGNVREWTATGAGDEAVVVGGGWRNAAHELRVTRRETVDAAGHAADLGFRCVREVER